MRLTTFLLLLILLILLWPVLLPLMGGLALLGAIGVGAGMVAANHAVADAPVPVSQPKRGEQPADSKDFSDPIYKLLAFIYDCHYNGYRC